MDMNTIQAKLLEIISKTNPSDGQFQQGSLLNKVAKELGIERDDVKEQALLTCWGNLFRNGYLSWGLNLNNPNPPFVHITETGARLLKSFSRDPANPTGYKAHLLSLAQINPTAMSYVEEALTTFNSNCYKAAAVMIGCASESIVLDLRDAIVAKLTALTRKPSSDLTDWRILRIIRAIQVELDKQKLSHALEEAYEAYWPAFTGHIRITRNDAGHPQGLAQIPEETVHANLLLFPSMAKLTCELTSWVGLHFA